MKKYLNYLIGLSAIICSSFLQCEGSKKLIINNLRQGFVNPPQSSRPRVWWHWMNGNITKEGIKADLEWMHRVGIGGFQNFDAAFGTPQVVEKRLVFMTQEWKDAFSYTTKLADSLKLEMAIAGSPGWSESGGPWVVPAQAMKKYVWSETWINGGEPYTGILSKPPTTTGVFQNIRREEGEFLVNGKPAPIPEYYADAAVVAFRVPDKEIPMAKLKPMVTSSGGSFTLAQLTDGDLSNSVLLPAAKLGEKAWIQFEFPEPQIVQSLSIAGGGRPGVYGIGRDPDNRSLEASDNGNEFYTVVTIPTGGAGQKTLTFTPVKAKYFRFTFKTEPSTLSGTQVAELILHTVPRVTRFEEKAGFATATDFAANPTPPNNTIDAINKANVVDLTSKMLSNGKLSWTPPPGKWIVLRIGYSLTGQQNGPASPEATGLEVDKLSADHVKSYFNKYLDQYKDATGGLMGRRGLQYIVTDSWEAGSQNWTDNMIIEFNKRRGYDIHPWLPVLAGHIVESAESSDRFLWDFRKTIADLIAECHYDQLTTLLKQRGMGRYSESHEGGRVINADGMEMKRTASIPMSATWTPRENETEVQIRCRADVRESASVAHIYGQNLVAAESLTAMYTAWAWSPETLKPTADMELAHGLNRFVIHTSVHQPVNDKIPGIGLGPFGQWFTRHETWAEEALPWTNYLARSCYMLQQGKFVADIVYFYGEDTNVTALFGSKLPDIPEGYNYDFVNSDALINVLSVKNGQITTPGGMCYQVMVLDSNSRQMSLPVLLKISEMVNAGAIIIGSKPICSPSLSDDPTMFKAIADQLWKTGIGENKVGKGKVYSGETLNEVLTKLGLTPDFRYTKPLNNTNLLFVHRKFGDVDLFWINNRNTHDETIEATFRVEDRVPEIWHPETGKMELASYTISRGQTTVPLKLTPNDAVFVVFCKKTHKSSLTLPGILETKLTTIEGPWNIKFQSNRGAPDLIVVDKLSSWSENTDSGVKYFSGTGTYAKTIQASENWFNTDHELWLDLGDVKNLAEVMINGKSLGIVWKKPFRVNITNELKPGENKLEIKITNLWVNRLIGDLQPGISKKYTFTTMSFYKTNSPLLSSGLLGPVQIVSLKKICD